jgi:hypothetical protein
LFSSSGRSLKPSSSLACEKNSFSSPQRLTTKSVVVLISPIFLSLNGVAHGNGVPFGSSRAQTSNSVVPARIGLSPFPTSYSKKRLFPSVAGKPGLGLNRRKNGKST